MHMTTRTATRLAIRTAIRAVSQQQSHNQAGKPAATAQIQPYPMLRLGQCQQLR